MFRNPNRLGSVGNVGRSPARHEIPRCSVVREDQSGTTRLNYPRKIWRHLLKRWWALWSPTLLRVEGVVLGKGVVFYGMAIVERRIGSSIDIGSGTVLCSDSRFTALGVNHPVILRTLQKGATIRIGRNVGLSGTTICAACEVSVGDECLFGANVTIADTDFHPIQPAGRRFSSDSSSIGVAKVKIGRNVFIGANSIVLKGVVVGDNSVIGAGSVVTREIPANSLAAGCPAVVLRQIGR